MITLGRAIRLLLTCSGMVCFQLAAVEDGPLRKWLQTTEITADIDRRLGDRMTLSVEIERSTNPGEPGKSGKVVSVELRERPNLNAAAVQETIESLVRRNVPNVDHIVVTTPQ